MLSKVRHPIGVLCHARTRYQGLDFECNLGVGHQPPAFHQDTDREGKRPASKRCFAWVEESKLRLAPTT